MRRSELAARFGLTGSEENLKKWKIRETNAAIFTKSNDEIIIDRLPL